MLVIFDWDGTLLDSTAKIIACMQGAVQECGLPALADHQVRQIIGLGLPEAVRLLLPGVSDEDAGRLIAAYSRHFIAADQTPCAFYPGVERVLAQLRADGHLLAVATGKSRRGLNRVLANLGLDSFFHASRCADETASKPSPLMVQQLLAELGVAAESAVMVGDTEFDLEMAVNAGVRSVAVSYGAHPVERLLKHQPALVIDRMAQLLDWEGLRG